jgi:hypothetical protein
VLLGANGGVRLMPDSWLGPRPRDVFRANMQRLTDLPIELLLLTHDRAVENGPAGAADVSALTRCGCHVCRQGRIFAIPRFERPLDRFRCPLERRGVEALDLSPEGRPEHDPVRSIARGYATRQLDRLDLDSVEARRS